MKELIILIFLISLIVFYFIYNKKKKNLKNDGFIESNNLINHNGLVKIIWLIQGHKYMLKNNLQNNKLLINNYITKKECNYFLDIVKKFHHKDTEIPEENKIPSIAFDHILADQIINNNKNNLELVKKITKAKEKFLNTANKILKICEDKFKKKLRIHSTNIICAFKGFSIPLHIDNNYYLIEHNNGKYFNIMAEDLEYNGPESSYIREEIPNSNKLLLPEESNEIHETNIIHTNNINKFQFQKKILDHSYDKYSGGGNDTHAVVSAILYLSTQGEDFLGGDLLIGIDKKVQPKKGDLLIFTGGPENLHQVTPVLKGERASLLVWCSDMPGQYKRNRIFSNEPTYV